MSLEIDVWQLLVIAFFSGMGSTLDAELAKKLVEYTRKKHKVLATKLREMNNDDEPR